MFAVAGSPCRRVEGIFAQRSTRSVNAIHSELIGRGVGILFDPLARLASPLVGLFFGRGPSAPIAHHAARAGASSK